VRPLLKPMRALDAGRGAARAAGGGGVREHARRQLGAGARHALGADARSDRPGALPGYLAVLAGPRSRGDCVLCLQRVGSAERDSGASARAATGRPAAQEALRQLDPELLQRLAQHMDVTDLITLFVHPRLALGLSDRDFTEVGRLTSPAWRGVHAAMQARVGCAKQLGTPPPRARVLPRPCGPALGPGQGPPAGAAPPWASVLGVRHARSNRAPRAPQADYEALLRLDDGVRTRQPVSEAQIDALPVHVHAAPPRVRAPAGQRAAGRVPPAPPCAPPACRPGRKPDGRSWARRTRAGAAGRRRRLRRPGHVQRVPGRL